MWSTRCWFTRREIPEPRTPTLPPNRTSFAQRQPPISRLPNDQQCLGKVQIVSALLAAVQSTPSIARIAGYALPIAGAEPTGQEQPFHISRRLQSQPITASKLLDLQESTPSSLDLAFSVCGARESWVPAMTEDLNSPTELAAAIGRVAMAVADVDECLVQVLVALLHPHPQPLRRNTDNVHRRDLFMRRRTPTVRT